MLFEDPESR